MKKNFRMIEVKADVWRAAKSRLRFSGAASLFGCLWVCVLLWWGTTRVIGVVPANDLFVALVTVICVALLLASTILGLTDMEGEA